MNNDKFDIANLNSKQVALLKDYERLMKMELGEEISLICYQKNKNEKVDKRKNEK